MPKFRKRPVIVEADVYSPGMEDAFGYRDVNGRVAMVYDGQGEPVMPEPHRGERVPVIVTLEGPMEISPGDYIITGVMGERYPCKPDIFHRTYEPLPEEGVALDPATFAAEKEE